MRMTMTSEIGTVASTTSVSGTEMVSIMMRVPMICTIEAMTCVMLWLSDCATVSTSLVMRESTSPMEFPSSEKYESPMTEIFSATCLRMRYESFWVTEAITHDWTRLADAEMR